MAVKNLAKKFEAAPALAFLSVLEDAKASIRTVSIKQAVVDAGIPKSKVDGAWATFQKYMLDHPNMKRSGPAAYVWSQEPVTAAVSLQRLSGYTGKRSCPSWLGKILVGRIEDSLRARVDGSNYVEDTDALTFQRLSDATVLAKVVGHIAEMVHAGSDIEAILKWCDRQTADSGLDEIGRIGEHVGFDAAVHSATAGYPRSGDRVEVIRPGYRWMGGDQPVLVLRAVVRVEP